MHRFIIVAILPLLLACTNNKRLTNPEISTSNNGDKSQEKRDTLFMQGIDFFAKGDIPAKWELAFSYTDSIRFINDNGVKLVSRNWQKVNADTTSDVITAKTALGTMTVFIDRELCEKSKARRTTVYLGESLKFLGCGSFTIPKNLQGKWQLDKIANKGYSGKDFPNGLPYLEIDATNGKMLGSDGCNKISSNISIEGKMIRFGSIASTKIVCTKNDFEQKLYTVISGKVVDYSFSNNRLIFYLSDDSIVEFVR